MNFIKLIMTLFVAALFLPATALGQGAAVDVYSEQPPEAGSGKGNDNEGGNDGRRQGGGDARSPSTRSGTSQSLGGSGSGSGFGSGSTSTDSSSPRAGDNSGSAGNGSKFGSSGEGNRRDRGFKSGVDEGAGGEVSSEVEGSATSSDALSEEEDFNAASAGGGGIGPGLWIVLAAILLSAGAFWFKARRNAGSA